MSEPAWWWVLLHDDEVTSFMVVVHLLHTLCETPLPEAAQLAAETHLRGEAAITAYPDQADAELLAVALQRRGLDASIRRSR